MTYREYDEYLSNQFSTHVKASLLESNLGARKIHVGKALAFKEARAEYRRNFRKLYPYFNDEF